MTRVRVVGLRPGTGGPRLVITVTEAPEAGRPNEALCPALAQALGLAAGAPSRDKILAVAAPLAVLRPRLKAFA